MAQPQQVVYVVLGAPGPNQQFIEAENEKGESIHVPLRPYPGKDDLWRLGPFVVAEQPAEG